MDRRTFARFQFALAATLCWSGAAAQPAPTPAAERLAGLAQRRALQEASLVSDVPFRSVGPTVMSGRVSDIEARAGDPSTFWVSYASGGLWKTTSGGADFQPLFDHEAVMTIGDFAVDERDPEGDGETIWVGTGEANSSRSSYAGAGLYRSTDGGRTWSHRGLAESHHIGRVLIDPEDPATVLVASLGPLYSSGGERGVFLTNDAGTTWRRTLFVDDTTGAVDLVRDPRDPRTLYAATWSRGRRAWDFREAGAGSAIWRSRDAGETWTRLTNPGGSFPSGADVGRIGLDIHWSGVLYAVVDNQGRRPPEEDEDEPALTRESLRAMSRAEFLAVAEEELTAFLDRNGFPLSYTAQGIIEMVREGTLEASDLVDFLEDANQQLFDTPVIGAEVYRSDDDGATWTRTHEGFLDDLFFSYGYYFGQIRVSPHDPRRLYLLGVPLIGSTDGGATWTGADGPSGEGDHVHVDHHALWLDPQLPGRLIAGNDGGLNVSFDGGTAWLKLNGPAVGQFYTVTVDDDRPYNVYGGLQDNGVWYGASDYRLSNAWRAGGSYPYRRLLGGDGMQVAIDPREGGDGARTVYAGFQFGNYFRIDRETGNAERVTPRHELGERPLRFNWQSPVHLSRHVPDVLYLGSARVHRSLDRGENWEAISPDLTRGSRAGDVPYGTITALAESPRRFGLLWAGSDDGRVHVTRDGGVSWTEASAGLPADYWVSRIEPGHHAEGRAYAALSGYRWDRFEALLFVTDDFGATWTRLGTDLPPEPINVVREDPEAEDLIYVGTDHGLYVSLDRGRHFMAFDGRTADTTGAGRLPAAPVHDLAVQNRDADLVAGTHGRSIWIVDIGLLRAMTPEVRSRALHAFPVDSLTYDEEWGSNGWTWGEAHEPSATIAYWSDDVGEVTLRIRDERRRTWATLTDQARHGLNLVRYDLTSERPQDDDHRPGEATGRYYLRPGSYLVEVRRGRAEARTDLTVAPAPAPPARGRKKTP